MSDSGFMKNRISFAISREMAIAHGLIEPTAEEREERDADLARWREQERARVAKEAGMLALLGTKADAVTVAVLALHSPSGERPWPSCAGCDQGCSCDDAAWPCSTILALAQVHGIETP